MKKLLLSSIIIIIGITFIGRLSYLQLFSFSPNQILDDPAIKKVYDYPERGYIYDRNGDLLVGNQPAYDVMVIPRDTKTLDTIEFCSLLGLKKEAFIAKIKTARRYSPRLPSVLVAQLSKEDYARLQEKMRKYQGLRDYVTKSSANVLGYISEVNESDLRNNPNYEAGELKGKTGIEKQYEDVLRGRKGVKRIQKDRFNREIGKYKNGTLDTLPELGTEIHITLDKTLQEYGEKLMHGKRGGIVAIEPSTGEILTMISGPTYNPDLLVGRERSKNYTKLYYDTIAKPTWDRSILAQPSPGSPFKILNALAALQEGVIETETKFKCYNGFYVGKNKRGCHCGGGVRDLNSGIFNSCNAYFAGTFRKIYGKYETTDEGMDVWEKHMKSFGLGNYLGTDLPTGVPGRIPNKAYYDNAYGDGRWASSFIISNAIGQGEIAATPIQLANMTAAIANKGFFYTPHIIKKIGDETSIDVKYTQRKYTTIDKKHFDPIINSMANVYKYGTAKWLRIKLL